MSGHTDIRRGGFDEVILYTGAGDVHSVGTRLKGSGEGEAAPAEEVEYFEGGDGHDYVQRREWAWAPVLVAQRDVEVVERWRREGKRIGAIGLGPVAALWRELVPIRLEDAGEGRGSFSGRRLRLRTRLLEAAVARSLDLFSGVQGEAAEGVLGQRWRAALPLGGRLLCIDADSEATLRIFDASGAQVREQAVVARGESLVLPGRTHTIEIDAEGRRPRVYLDAGGPGPCGDRAPGSDGGKGPRGERWHDPATAPDIGVLLAHDYHDPATAPDASAALVTIPQQ